MSTFKVVLTDNIFPDLIIEREMLAKVDAELVEVTDPSKLAEEVKDADAVINTYAELTADIIGGMQKCRLIIRNGIGVNTIDVDADKATTILKLIDALEDNDDVQKVASNFEVSDEVLAQLSA